MRYCYIQTTAIVLSGDSWSIYHEETCQFPRGLTLKETSFSNIEVTYFMVQYLIFFYHTSYSCLDYSKLNELKLVWLKEVVIIFVIWIDYIAHFITFVIKNQIILCIDKIIILFVFKCIYKFILKYLLCFLILSHHCTITLYWSIGCHSAFFF